MKAQLPGFAREPLVLGATALFALLLVLYSFSIGLRATRGASITGDEPFYLLTTQSLLQDGNLDLTRQYERQSYRSFFDHPDGLWKQSIPTEDGRLLSPHEPALSVFLLPGFAIGGLHGAQIQMMVLTAATFALAFFLIASETGALLLSWLATTTVALTATAFVYSTEIYPEVPAAMLLVLSLLIMRRPALGLIHVVVLAALLTLLAWFGMKYVPLGSFVALYVLWRSDWRGRTSFVALSAASAAAYIWFHFAVYDSLTAYSVNTVFEGASTAEVLQSHLALNERVYRLWGLFVDQRFGVGRWAPVILLVLPALPLLLKRGGLGLLALSLVAMQILIATFVAVTMMGWWFPGRTLVAVFPLFAFVLAELLIRLPVIARVGAAALGTYSLVIVVALVRATQGGDITLAVDPFDMPSDLFQVSARLFPNYVSWTTDTVLRTIVWVSAGLSIAALLAWRELEPSKRHPNDDEHLLAKRLGISVQSSALAAAPPTRSAVEQRSN